MTDVLIRDVPDDVIAALDAHAGRLGLSRSEYVRRRLAQDAATPGSPVSVQDLARFADLMNVHWEYKRQRDPKISSDAINGWYNLARANGALGGKLIGAGGGGFLLFYAEDRIRLRRALRDAGLEEVRFRFDFEGTKVVIQS